MMPEIRIRNANFIFHTPRYPLPNSYKTFRLSNTFCAGRFIVRRSGPIRLKIINVLQAIRPELREHPCRWEVLYWFGSSTPQWGWPSGPIIHRKLLAMPAGHATAANTSSLSPRCPPSISSPVDLGPAKFTKSVCPRYAEHGPIF